MASKDLYTSPHFLYFMKSLLLKKCIILFFLLVIVSFVSADLFVVSVDRDINCKDYKDNITICQKNPAYDLIEKDIVPSIDVHYYDNILNDVVKSKNEKIENLENSVTGYATQSSEISDWYSAMEKVYLAGIIILALLLVNAYYQIYKLKRER